MRKNDAFDAKIVNTRLTKIFIAIFAPNEREAGEDTGTYFKEITDLEFQNHKNVKKKCTFCTLEQAGTNLCSMGCQTQILR